MYRIINAQNGSLMGLVEKPLFIRLHENGCYVACKEEEAEGIAFNSTPYSLFNKNLRGAVAPIIYREEDGGIYIGEQLNTLYNSQKDSDAMLVDQEFRLTMLELGITA